MERQYHPIRTLRRGLGLTQGEFGKPLSLSAVRVCQIENDGAIGSDNALKVWDVYREEMIAAGLRLEDLLRSSEGHTA